MKIIINDANILIDLVQLNLIEEFVQLPFDLKTTDFVYKNFMTIKKIPFSFI